MFAKLLIGIKGNFYLNFTICIVILIQDFDLARQKHGRNLMSRLSFVKQMPLFISILNNNKLRMHRKKSKWSKEEQAMLKDIKETQIKENQVNWEIIAKEINGKFEKNRTSKQCRERYINYLKFDQMVEDNFLNWSQQENNTLMRLYLEYGPSWSTISTFFKDKSQNHIKNKFNNLIRKGAKLLQEHERKNTTNQKKKVTSQILTIMIDLANKIKKAVKQIDQLENQNCMILKFYHKIIGFCFRSDLSSQDDIEEILMLMKQINGKIRSFGFFKVKNRKHWKLTEKCLQSICQYDQVIKKDETEQDASANKFSSMQDQEVASQNTVQSSNSIQMLELPILQETAKVKNSDWKEQVLFDVLGEAVRADIVPIPYCF